MSVMNRGEVWWVNFEPSIGGEIRKRRPAVIISNNAANKYLNRLQVVPLTSTDDRLYPSEALVTLQGRQNKAMADQLTTVSKRRLINRIGHLSGADMRQVERAVKIQLGLSNAIEEA
jgi:mRNA interferase MazF